MTVATVPAVDGSRCSGCGRCVAACSTRSVTLDVSGWRKVSRIASDRCDGCRCCVAACPINALR